MNFMQRHKLKPKKQFYIYAHCRPDGEPFYIGKGHSRRSHDFIRNRSNHHKNIVAEHGKKNILIYTRNCESEQQAFKHEVWMIAWCRAQGYRITNMTDGGEGVSGYKHTDISKEVVSLKNKENINCRHYGNTYRKGSHHTVKSIEKMKVSHVGKNIGCKHSEESKRIRSVKAKAQWAKKTLRLKMQRRIKEGMKGKVSRWGTVYA